MYFLLGSSVFLMTMHVAIVVAIGVRVVMRRAARGVALSWLLLVATLPFFGVLVYLLIGERRIGRKRSRAITALRTDFRQIARATIPADFTAVTWPDLPATAQAMDRLGDRWSVSPPFAATLSNSLPTPRRFSRRLSAMSMQQEPAC